ncbi:MAG: PsbP-related protein [Methanobacteriaceae archaeon]|jgi:hypothetical protein|nr:PsbP-related protein [Methanobacteriaceae archaeon]MDO9625995.1 PsbP-related protein [Methanobacteriaceae archaeon]
MTRTCSNCGHENEDGSKFCKNCGSELRVLKNVYKVSEHEPEQKNWFKRQNNGVKALIGIVGLCCIGVILLVVISGMMAPDATTDSTSTSTTSSPSTSSSTSSSLQTFNGGGISFQYPNNWNEYTPEEESADRVASLETDAGDYSLLSVYVEESDENLEYWKDIVVNNPYSSNVVVDQKSIQIDGVDGYRVDSSYSNSGNSGYQSNIIFVKNGKYYKLLFTTSSLAAIDSDMNTIINSFRTT